MRSLRGGMFQSLGVRLLVSLFLTIVVVLAVHATLSFRSTEDDLMGLVNADINRSSGLIKGATHDGMLLNRKAEVQATIERLAAEPEIAAIRVYDKHGTIVMSARADEIGKWIEIDSETCRSCHEEDQQTKENAVMERSGLTKVDGGPEVLRHLSIIENEATCTAAGCHRSPNEEPVLGVLDVEMSMAPLQAAVHNAKTQLFWTTLVLVLVVGAVVAVFVKRLVSLPVAQLREGTRRIAGGDLETRIPVHGRHELASLAEAFNHMADDLCASRREVLEWSQKLEEKVVEKTQELSRTQQQVLHMEKMASLGKLSATVAHELNNPIGGVLTYARLVRRELGEQSLDESVRNEMTRYLTLVENECLRCGDIVKNLLLFARRDGARFAPVDVNEIVERSLMLVRHHLVLGGVEVNCELIEGDSHIHADGGQLQQALIALMVNADEAMQESGGDKELWVRVHDKGEEIEIEIADTGVGIPAESMPHIFDPFFSTKEMESRVGLGLAVVYGIANRHGGRVDVESTVGQGTVFRLRLPRKPKPEAESVPARHEAIDQPT